MSDRTLGIVATVIAVAFVIATVAGVWHRSDVILAHFVVEDPV